MSTKRTSIKQAKSPLDELFSRTDKPDKADEDEKELILRDRQTPGYERESLRVLSEEIKTKKRQQQRRAKEAEKALIKARKKAKKTDEGIARTTSLLLYDYQHEWLEMKRIESRISGGKKISKAEILRSLVDAAMDRIGICPPDGGSNS